MPEPASPPRTEPKTALSKALKENEEAAKAVEAAADDLAVVHAVLDSGVPKETASSDVKRAVEQTGDLEKQLSASSEKLKKVNEALKRASTKGGA